MDANMAISPSCTRAWTVNLCRGGGENARFWGSAGAGNKWTAGLMALRGGHQSRSDRPMAVSLGGAPNGHKARRKARPGFAVGERSAWVKIVMECRRGCALRGAAKQKR